MIAHVIVTEAVSRGAICGKLIAGSYNFGGSVNSLSQSE